MSTEDNKLIAEFMGYSQPHPDYPTTTYWYKESEAPLTILAYDTDWNWLMPVVEKILDLSLNLDTMEMYYNITDSIPRIDHVYLSCVEFIEWHNKLSSNFEDIYHFEDWVSHMLDSNIYNTFELMCFEEHYQNLLTFEQNTKIFVNYENN